VSVNGTQVEDKMRTFKGECAQFSFNRCPVYTHDGASAKFSTSSQETNNSVETKADGLRQFCCEKNPMKNSEWEALDKKIFLYFHVL
jgi:hypothetical protein